MSGLNPPAYFCPEAGCRFAYTADQPNALKTHKLSVHIQSVKVSYTIPAETFVLHRVDGFFHCHRCEVSSVYPSAMQVRYSLVFRFKK